MQDLLLEVASSQTSGSADRSVSTTRSLVKASSLTRSFSHRLHLDHHRLLFPCRRVAPLLEALLGCQFEVPTGRANLSQRQELTIGLNNTNYDIEVKIITTNSLQKIITSNSFISTCRRILLAELAQLGQNHGPRIPEGPVYR